MKRLGATTGLVATLSLLAVTLAMAAEGTPVASPAASPVAIACGAPITSFGGPATASDVEVTLHQVVTAASAATPGATGTPAAMARVAVDVTIANHGGSALRYAPSDFVLLDCQGRQHTAISGGKAPAIVAGELAPGGTVQGWISFEIPADTRPARLTYTIMVPNQTGARVEFPLAMPGTATPVAGAKCSAGVAVGGNGANGANATGGNAVGGNGANGGNATGGSAIGGNGGNGGDAIGGSAVGGNATAASNVGGSATGAISTGGCS